jgi:hypothetical protein
MLVFKQSKEEKKYKTSLRAELVVTATPSIKA